MTTRLILTLAAVLTLAACVNNTPATESGVAVTGEAQMGVVVGDTESDTAEY